MALTSLPPLGLYIHLPWCEKKCPYCDFNSHQDSNFPESDYIDALLTDLTHELPLIWGRQVESLFIGGGTPSLFSGDAIDRLMSGLRGLLKLNPAIEATIESNPGSADSSHFKQYREAGLNRISIGVQSFNTQHLERLGRIHDGDDALAAFEYARNAGFDNINLDLMYGLPGQSLEQACDDIKQAIRLKPEHISHYQLTIEPNTYFHRYPPAQLPDDELSWQQQVECQQLLALSNYNQYEISAYSQNNRQCQHNLNYWIFGDYIGIGAGAHGKLSLPADGKILRRIRQKQPRRYLDQIDQADAIQQVEPTDSDLMFEFMLNALRLTDGFKTAWFHENTGLSFSHLLPHMEAAAVRKLIKYDGEKACPTELGFRFLNDLQTMFLDKKIKINQAFFDSSESFIHS
ncbi:MAG: putative oxygen-independent coproporphyrinogen III oxidase [Gammaproteobacteria bacterium]|jgi:putative oxygen-independent coproporphyrinogen III oxidase